jgi:hypothetical protein
MDICEMNMCFDHCTFEEKCFVHFSATQEDAMHKVNCETFEAVMSGECVDVEERGSCKQEISEHIDDVRRCDYYVKFNTCEEDSEECTVEIEIGDELYEFDDCDEANDHFDLPDCNDEFEEGDCMDIVGDLINGVEQCNYQEYVNSCSGESTWCYAELVVDGMPVAGNCDDLEEMFGFDSDDMCDEEPVMEHGDCLEDIRPYVDGASECKYEVHIDACSGDELTCSARVVVYDMVFEDECDVLQDMFEIPDDDDDDHDECE